MRKRLRIPARYRVAFAAVCGALSCQAAVFPHTATREYNAIVRLEDSAGRVTRWHYDRAGRAVALGLPNGQQQDNDYDAVGRLIGRTLYAPAGSANPGTEDPAGILAAFGWQHDAAGNVIAQIELWPGGGASGGAPLRGSQKFLTLLRRAKHFVPRSNPVSSPIQPCFIGFAPRH